MAKYATVVDNKGDAYSGKVVDTSSPVDVLTTICTGGISGMLEGNKTTVEVNGERHSGTKIQDK
ncbi:Uncharacterized protein dnl_51530 [Desulfonema limicola]|uniref:Uncharacterized protein n=1 Tax=Desulfonema limicola TaxID=45656 RepID=A0A975GIM8_9BACT|nr:hypothetical protein [Desulfonema limicola]QTA82770.1 Uncharacterized protein dnl_51530 [Desulfonema limicola]